MSTARVKRSRPRGFTLLEIALATAILGMMCLAVYRFVQTNITVLRHSAADTLDEARYNGLLDLLTTQWQSLPSGVGALGGETFMFNQRPRDEIVWVCSAGPGLMTRYAGGEFSVRMRLRPMKDSGDKMELGFLRRPLETAEGSDEGETWVPLIDDVRGMRIRYFDPSRNAWIPQWNIPGSLPRLVEVILERPNRPNWQAIIALGRTPF